MAKIQIADLIELTLSENVMHTFERAIAKENGQDYTPQKEKVLISPSSIASIESNGSNSLIIMKEQRHESNISYNVDESVDEIKELIEYASMSESAKSIRDLEEMKRNRV